MSKITIVGDPCPNMPWQDRPEGLDDVCWRYSENPIVTRDHAKGANSIFNSAVVPFKGKFAGVFRIDDKKRWMTLRRAFSDDAINWKIDDELLPLEGADPEIAKFQYGYDPRVCWIEDRWWVTWCNGYHGPTIGVAWTKDFESFHQVENAYLPFNRNGVMFPRKIGSNYAMYSRPSDNGHTPFGDIYYSESPDMTYWGKHRYVFGTTGGWQATKIGAGPIPIETSEGWLLIYHGVLTSCNGFVYSFGAALMDLEQPWKTIARGSEYMIHPRELYETVGDVPNVCFPCAALVDPPTDRLAIYYGSADTTVSLAFAKVSELIEWTKANNMLK